MISILKEFPQIRKWELQDYIGNYLNADLYAEKFCLEKRTIKTFCKEFGIKENKIADYYAESINEGGYEIAYAINEDVILVIE